MLSINRAAYLFAASVCSPPPLPSFSSTKRKAGRYQRNPALHNRRRTNSGIRRTVATPYNAGRTLWLRQALARNSNRRRPKQTFDLVATLFEGHAVMGTSGTWYSANTWSKADAEGRKGGPTISRATMLSDAGASVANLCLFCSLV